MEAPDRRTAGLAALEAHRRMADEKPNDPGFCFRLGMITHGLGLELLEESASAFRRSSDLLRTQGEVGEAYERARAMEAYCILAMGYAAKAQAHIEAQLSERPESPSALAVRAEYYLRLNQQEAAVADLARAESLAPGHPLVTAVRERHSL